MKRIILYVLICLLGFNNTFAQDDPQPDRKEILEKIIKNYMMKKLDLTQDESVKFFPEFKSYMVEYAAAVKNSGGDVIKKNESIVVVQKKFKPRFQAILKDEKRANRVFDAHGRMAQEIRKRLKERGNRGGDRGRNV
jgi:hypothetical protein